MLLLACCLLGITPVVAQERPVRVLVWDEQQPEQKQAYGDKFLGETIAAYLSTRPGFEVSTAHLRSPDQGLSEKTLEATDVVIWWGHVKHRDVQDEFAERVVRRVREGKLSLIALHSAHWAKPFVRLMQERAIEDAKRQMAAGGDGGEAPGKLELVNDKPIGIPVQRNSSLTPRLDRHGDRWQLHLPACVFPGWRGDGAPSHVTTSAPDHPIARGLPRTWHIAHTEMYDEPFHVPEPDEVVFEEKWDKGERFRSGCVWRVGRGRVFYFRPGHETFAVYHNAEPLRVIENAAHWLGQSKDALMSWTPEQTLQIHRVGAVQVSPDGQSVAYAVRKAVMADGASHYVTHLQVARTDGSQTRQATRGDKSCDDPQWSPDGAWLAFLSDRPVVADKPSKRNLWILPVAGGEAVPLTNFQGGVAGYKWSPDGRSIAFLGLDPVTDAEEQAAKDKNDARTLDENVKFHRLYVASFALSPSTGTPTLDAQPRRLTPDAICVNADGGRPGRAPLDWSPDGRSIVFSQVTTPSPDHWPTADVLRVEVATGAVQSLLASPRAESSPLYSPDGKWIALVASGDRPTWAGAGRVEIIPSDGSAAPKPLAATFDGFGRYSELIGWSSDSQWIYFTEAHGVDLRIGALPVDGGPPREVYSAPGMNIAGVFLNATRTQMGFAWETSDAPSEAWVASVADFKPHVVSRVNADVERPALGRTERVRWRTADGPEIEGLLTLPVGYEKGKRYPLLLVIHGGPMGVFSQTYIGNAGTYPVAVFAARGYAVLRPNPRGSSGYGAPFRHANRNDWGGGDYRDLMAGVEHLIQTGVADPERMGVMGWSYGGFMTSWIITQTKQFRCASVGAGVTNLMSFTGTADIPGFLPDYFGGEFWDVPQTYAEHSPMTHVKGVTTPTLIQHGERDERVPLSQGLELYNALKRQGCSTRMVVYPRTPHGIDEPRLMLHAMQGNVEWFDKHLASGR
ncbi:MAG: prolyl oligopeptidase family serine peptidase [Pirellulales bacterium]